MKLLTVFILFLLVKINCIAQPNSASISGKIVSDKGISTPSASVALFTLKDSSLYKVVLASSNGEYEMKGLKPGKYFLTVTSIGFKKGGTTSFELKESQSYFLAPITLSTDHTR